MRPKELVLRCYGYRDAHGKWCGVCLDFNLAAEADSITELRTKINAMIESYVEAVLDTERRRLHPPAFPPSCASFGLAALLPDFIADLRKG